MLDLLFSKAGYGDDISVCIVKTSEKLNVGEFYNIKITNLDGIDLVGKVI